VQNPFKRKPKPYLLIEVYQELAYGIESGDSTDDFIDLLIEEVEEREVTSQLQQIRKKLTAGDSLGKSVAAVTMEKADFAARLIDGSAPKFLDKSFNLLASLKERESNLQSFSWREVSYPLALLAILILLLFFINVTIIPQFQEMFSAFGADLPSLTKFLFSVSKLGAWVWIAPVILFALLIPAYKKSKTVRSYIDLGILRFPFYGKIFHAFHLNEFLNRVASLRAATEFDDEQVLDLACSGITNSSLRKRIKSTGFSNDLLQWLKQTPDIPSRVRRIISRGKDKDRIWSDIERYLKFQTRRLDDQASRNLSNLVVFLSAAIYVVAGLFVVSVYLPIFKLGSVI
jgi:type IV pilus assembly protein PilC